MSKLNKSRDYFDWQWWRFAFAAGAYWTRIEFKDGEYRRLIFGLYWKKARLAAYNRELLDINEAMGSDISLLLLWKREALDCLSRCTGNNLEADEQRHRLLKARGNEGGE